LFIPHSLSWFFPSQLLLSSKILQPRCISIIVLTKRTRKRSYYYYDYSKTSKTLLAAQRFYNWLNAMKISSSRFLKEAGSRICHEKRFKDNRRTVVTLLSILMIAVTSLTNTITTPLSLFFNQEEARASQSTVGLRVFVDLYHNQRGSAQLCIHSFDQDLGCKTLSLRQYSSPIRYGSWTFSPGMVEVGETFRVCVTNLNTGGQSRCISGINGPEKEPEYVSLTVPGTQQQLPAPPPPSQQLPGFLRGPNWRQICNDYDMYIIEPCGTLVTPDGYGLTTEGLRVLACFAGGALVLIYPQLAAYSYMCGQGGGSQR
jgi:hypothetical protein